MTMAEYIERDSAVAKITELINQSGKYTDYECGADDACFIVDHIPAADVVARDCYDRLLTENDELRKERPVVRCKDCRKGIPDSEHATAYSCYGIWHKPDWFCAGGLRKDGDGDA